MLRKKMTIVGLTITLCFASATTVLAETTTTLNTTTMESCGAYLFEWRPIDCGNGHYFAILVGGNSVTEKDVILNRGYDYAYTFNPGQYPKPWGQAPDLVNADGLWAIPENWELLPEGTQQTLQLVLLTNNNKLPDKERFINIVSLPSNINSAELPPEVKKYLINVDGSDAGAYSGTKTTGWEKQEDGTYRYRKPDGTYVSNGWLNVDDELYYMDTNGIMLADTVTPDGHYVNIKGIQQKYTPGWVQNENGWKYVLKNGYYAASTWFQDVDGKWYYFNMGGYMIINTQTPDGYYVDANGVWDGQPTTMANTKNLGPGFAQEESVE